MSYVVGDGVYDVPLHRRIYFSGDYMDIPNRKPTRCKNFDYSSAGAYFITICVKDRKNLLGQIVGTGVLDGPLNKLSDYGKIAERYILQLNDFYEHLSVDNFVIMPNHIHILLSVLKYDGPSGTPVPTNNTISRFVSTFKRFCNKEYGRNIWQRSFNDHIIRNENDYLVRWNYIDSNPAKWCDDRYYVE